MDFSTMYQFKQDVTDEVKTQIIEEIHCNQQGLITETAFEEHPEFADSFEKVTE